MDATTYSITIALMVCIGLSGVFAVAGSIKGSLVWYPAYRKKKVDALKTTDRQREARILQLPNHRLGGYRRAVFTLVPIRLEIRIAGLDLYEGDKTFTIPTHALDFLEKGKVVPVWVDPKNPRDVDKIVIDL